MDNIKEYLVNILQSIKIDDSVNLYDLSKNVYKMLKNKYQDIEKSINEKGVFEILQNIRDQNNNKENADDVIDFPKQIITEASNIVKNMYLPIDETFDVYSEIKYEVLPKYRDIGDVFVSNKIIIENEEIYREAETLIEIINIESRKIVYEIAKLLDSNIASINEIEELDSEIKDVDLEDFDYNDWEKIKQTIPSSTFKYADESFFKTPENIIKGKDGKDYYVFQDGDNTYKYCIKDKKFYINDKALGGNVYISIPDGISDYSKLNTITMLTGPDEQKKDVNKNGNAIVISFSNADTSNYKAPDNIAAITKLVNHAANTDLLKCQNIITGGSRFGARSLKIAASTKDLYQTVICVNNAILVKGENADGSGKEAFGSLEDLQGLNGKNIYFISTRKDSNIYRTIGNTDTQVSNGYLYTGIELAIDNCPDSQIYLIENHGDPAFKELKGPNFHYRPDLWSVVTNDSENKYADHGDYNKILSDLCTSNLAGYNGYSDTSSPSYQYSAHESSVSGKEL